jgi:peptidoglycan-N-acetylglucosamine deacetylase
MISVVVPAHNESKLIRESLESLFQQDYKGEYEVIVVDNNSRDNTSEIAQQAGAKIVLCQTPGVGYARQAGAEAARGDIIVQADADTLYPPWWLERIQKQFDKRPGAVAVAGTFIYRKAPWWAIFEYFLRSFFGILSSLGLGRPLIISGANLAFRKEAFIAMGGYRPRAYSADQIDIATRLRKFGRVYYDWRSYCRTSNRSVAKPVYRIFFDFVRHLWKFGQWASKPAEKGMEKKAGEASFIGRRGWVLSILPVLVIGLLCYGYFVPSSPVFGKVFSRAAVHTKLIALTFDDGPNEPYTSQILDELEKYDVQATFFLVGANVKMYPETARRMIADEDVIGNHTFSHNANHALKPHAAKEIALAQEAIAAVTGVQPHLFRPPHGKKSPWEMDYLNKHGYAEVLWNISTGELSGNTPQFMADQIIKKAKPGGIILLHDGYGTLHNGGRADKSATVEMVPIIIQKLQDEGYTFVTVPELLDIPAYQESK